MDCRVAAVLGAVLVFSASPSLSADTTAVGTPDELSNLSIKELTRIKVRSASKRDEPLSEVPSALYVIDHDQIVRSGAQTIPQILRLAPNLQVYQRTPTQWVVTARGLNGNPGLQSFSNKLLVLLDGRTVYAPHFSGVYWDLQSAVSELISRLEVQVGLHLFDRSGRYPKLTPEGIVLLADARGIIADVEFMRARAKGMAS